jgi:hypothetical protein
LTRKDFELIAEVIRCLPANVRTPVALVFAHRLAQAESRFDRQRFIDACDIEGKELS